MSDNNKIIIKILIKKSPRINQDDFDKLAVFDRYILKAIVF